MEKVLIRKRKCVIGNEMAGSFHEISQSSDFDRPCFSELISDLRGNGREVLVQKIGNSCFFIECKLKTTAVIEAARIVFVKIELFQE